MFFHQVYDTSNKMHPVVFDTRNSLQHKPQLFLLKVQSYQLLTSPIVRFCTTWGKKTNQVLHF